jgi:hypothetical protein
MGARRSAVAGEPGAEAVRDRIEERRAEPDRQGVDDREQLLGFLAVVELERRFERVQEAEFDVLRRDPHRCVCLEGPVGGRERVGQVAFREPDRRDSALVATLHLDLAR